MKLLFASVLGLLVALAAALPLSRQMQFEPVPVDVTPAPVVEPLLPPPTPAAKPVGPTPETPAANPPPANAPANPPAQPEIVVTTPEPIVPVVPVDTPAAIPVPAKPSVAALKPSVAAPAPSVAPAAPSVAPAAPSVAPAAPSIAPAAPSVAPPAPSAAFVGPTAIPQPPSGMIFEPPTNNTVEPPTVVEPTPLPPVVVTMTDAPTPAPVVIPPRRTPAVLAENVGPSPAVVPDVVPEGAPLVEATPAPVSSTVPTIVEGTPAPVPVTTPVVEVTPIPVVVLPSPSVPAGVPTPLVPEPTNIVITLPTAEPLVDTLPNSPFGAFPEPSPGSPSGAVCFPGSATVALKDGSEKRMDSLQIGDSIAVGGGKFSSVFMFTHKMADTRHSFVELTAAGKSLRLTEGHYLYVNGRLAAARTARAGDIVSVDGVDSTISSVRTVQDVGLYNPQTEHGDVLVGGFAASTYTEAVHPSAAHALLAPLRALYARLAFSTKMVESGADTAAACMPKGQAVF